MPEDLKLSVLSSESVSTAGLPEIAPQFLDFGSQMRFNRLLAIYRRGSRIFATRASLEELITLLSPQLERNRVCNDFEWKTLLLLSAAAFQLGDAGTRTRAALCAQRCHEYASTHWARMAMSACTAQIRSSAMLELESQLDDLDHIGNTAAVMLSQAAYSHGNKELLARSVARMTLYEEGYSFPGDPRVQYHLGLAMQKALEEKRLDIFALQPFMKRLETDTQRQAWRIGIEALKQFRPGDVQPFGSGESVEDAASG